jgi:sialate O-acetylesterase
MIKPSTAFAIVLTVVCVAEMSRADVKVPSIFGDHMVLQRGTKVPIWGSADPGEKVTVKTGQQEKGATADAKGKWRVVLDSIESKDPIEITISGKNTLTLSDVLVGEVWLCSGQSNMAFALSNATGGAAAVKAADRPTMRLFTPGRSTPREPMDDVKGEWVVCTPESAKSFSAVAYFFGSELQKDLNQPIGLIDSSWGGTRAEAWMPKARFDALKLPHEPAWTEQWLNPKPDPKAKVQEKPRPHEAPAVLFNGMIAPMAGYAIRGAVWYQGETNTAYPKEYRDVLASMIGGWREAWQQGDFPFLVIQLPNFDSGTRDWVTMRASQAQVAKDVPNVGLVITIDIGEPKDIHPKDKLTVGKRAALVARKLAYGEDVEGAGPTFKSMRIDGNNAIIEFDHVEGDLVARGGALQGFDIAGPDGNFIPADARIDGPRVIVNAAGVSLPKSVRYGWANNPKCTLYNAADLPTVPFEAK